VGGTSGGGTTQNRDSTISQIIVPVKIATPDADGKLYHEVRAGQSFWAIAVAYKITIKDIEIWNNISRNTPLKVGLKLFIPTSNTAGYSTPTPVGMVRVATPDADGKVVHVVEAYHTLSTIAKAYGITVEQILQMNGLQLDWPLLIGQKIIINPGNVTPSPTPRPLTPLEKLTPESDGKLYHTVQSGETLYWIANLYGVGLNELMAWNGLSNDSVIKPDQKLVLQVTMPATATNTPGPPTLTPVPTNAAATTTPSPTTTRPMETATLPATPTTTDRSRQIVPLAIGVVGLLSGGLFLFGILTRKKI
jgi:LysM repeat protein